MTIAHLSIKDTWLCHTILPPNTPLNKDVTNVPFFRGSVFLIDHLPLSSPVLPSHIIAIQFQTSSPNAMLLYAQGNYDFLALELIRGFLVYTYNLGTGRVILTSNHTYHDGLDHSVSSHATE